jgi:hypothetical protein
MCNVARYLEDQMYGCRDLAISAPKNSSAQIEWAQVALMLQREQHKHLERCQTCKQSKVAAA